MSKKLFWNIYFCIVLPMIVSGLITVGFFYSFQDDIFPKEIVLFFGGWVAYAVSSLVRSNFKWSKIKQ